MSVRTVAEHLPQPLVHNSEEIYIENRSYAAGTFSKRHTKSSSWPHNTIPQDTNLRNSVPQQYFRHERTFSDSYRSRSLIKNHPPIIPRPHSTPRHASNLISALPPCMRAGSTSSPLDKIGAELLPPTPNVAKEREKWLMMNAHGMKNGRQVSFSETVVIISDGAETQNTMSTLQLDPSSRRPQSPPPKHSPFALSPPPPPPPTSSAIVIGTYDDSQLAMDFAEDIPSEDSFFSKLLSKVGKRFM